MTDDPTLLQHISVQIASGASGAPHRKDINIYKYPLHCKVAWYNKAIKPNYSSLPDSQLPPLGINVVFFSIGYLDNLYAMYTELRQHGYSDWLVLKC